MFCDLSQVFRYVDIFITHGLLKMNKVTNITDIQNGKQVLLCLHFIYLRISLFRIPILNDEYVVLMTADIDSLFLSHR